MDSDFFRAKKDVIYNVSQKLTTGLFISFLQRSIEQSQMFLMYHVEKMK